MSVWEQIEENRKRLDVTSGDQVELRLLREYVRRVEASLNELIAYADDSIGGQYGTLRASFVRDAAIAILEDDDLPLDAAVMRYGDKSTTIRNLAPPEED